MIEIGQYTHYKRSLKKKGRNFQAKIDSIKNGTVSLIDLKDGSYHYKYVYQIKLLTTREIQNMFDKKGVK